MEGALVSAAAGALKPVVEKLGAALAKEYKRFKGVRGEIKVLTSELTSMHAFLLKMSEDEDPDLQEKAWAKEVRELSYDIEDNLDDFMLSVDGESAKRDSLIDKMKNLMEKTKARRRIAKAIEDFKKQVIEVGKRNARYKIHEAIAKPSNARTDDRALAMFEDVSKLIGIDGPKNEVIKLLTQEMGSGSSKQHLKVVSIVGFGGLGKTTLANKVYEELKVQFECQAFVSVSRNPDIMTILRTILSKVSGKPYRDTEAGSREQLMADIREILQDKRYIVVVDDVWKKEQWDIIKCAFAINSNGSRIIITTRIGDVAESWSSSVGHHVYRIRPLDPVDSRRLFLGRIFGSEDKCPSHLMEVSDKILKQSDGLPLALISISGLLASKPHTKDEWYRVARSMGRALEKNSDVESMMKILSLSYFDLPPHLKTCLLYLSIFPEDYVIDKIRLVRRWITEGFIHEEQKGFIQQGGQRHTLYELGEMCFNELINRSLIIPACTDMWGEVTACRVHDTILDFIISKSVEENFVVLSGDGYPMLKKRDKVRRLSLLAGSPKNVGILAGLDLSHVRSLTALEYPVELPCLRQWDMRFLRVVDFEGCQKLEGHHLANMGDLFQLKYLSVRGSGVRELPDQIGKLQYLETLNLGNTRVTKLPESIAGLRRLVHMVIDQGVKLPADGIGSMVALQELECVDIFMQPIQFTQDIGKLTDLRVVRLYVGHFDLRNSSRGRRKGYKYKEYMNNILSSLAKLQYLHSLSISIDWEEEYFVPFSLDSGGSVPKGLRTFVISGRYGHATYVSKVPNWIGFLVNLQRVILYVMEFEMKDIVVLGRLPALAILQLAAPESFAGTSVTVSGNHGFESLRRFVFSCVVPVMFQDGAMPKLEELTLMFTAEKIQMQAGEGDFPFGIQHLLSLGSVRCVIHYGSMIAKIRAWEDEVNVMEAQIDEMSSEAAMVKLAEMEAAVAHMSVFRAKEGAQSAIKRQVKVHPNAPKLVLCETTKWSVLNPLQFPWSWMSLMSAEERIVRIKARTMEKRLEVEMRFRSCQLLRAKAGGGSSQIRRRRLPHPSATSLSRPLHRSSPRPLDS